MEHSGVTRVSHPILPKPDLTLVGYTTMTYDFQVSNLCEIMLTNKEQILPEFRTRRVFIASTLTTLLTGCDSLKSRSIPLYYANATGRWLEGPISIGSIIYDMFGGGPFSIFQTSARINLLENSDFHLRCQDIFSKEILTTEGKISKCDTQIANPSLLLSFQNDGSIRSSWQEANYSLLQKRIVDNQSITSPFFYSIARQKTSTKCMSIAIRQRPERFATTWNVSDFQHRLSRAFLFDVSRVMSPTNGWETVVFFSTDRLAVSDSAITWRDTFDLREAPGFESPNSILWIEVERNGQYKLAWKRHPETSERQLREQLQRDELEPPQDWLVRQAQPHDELTLVSLHRGNQTKIPDLRFDDEIAQQKQKP
jgi:hypothetical protein